ncbi:DNA-binding transcriptional LysR family regulator [Streptomyces sp. SAI-135]|jgi:DNA-binding transcriptional LysR family regulator|uniref:LysR family transcriptional regulator n=1 Tax=unclassified Streptomyces TaxID=2593676 RepID=UPI002473826E|nr:MULTISPECIES: LysR family transcriptional regulator [unclassified Streptomyces]MDH6513748.1 DNA-binding transcriptional LysR family regulator [Streptomyces sp. SAI-090]MDH6622172.1 DNA-binding transcriptional LysR family regulator [Streptomyces sp. SAI-135]
MGLGAIDLNLLVALEALLEEKNVTHAGVRLSTSQSAMSGSLARLRRHFNDELLIRVGREYELTPLAERLLPVVQASLHKAEEALSLTRHFAPSRSRQRFSVVMSDYVMTVLVEPLLRIIAEEAPGVRIDFHPIIGGQLENETHLRCHDLMVVPLGYQLPGVSEAVMHDRFVCIVDPRNPWLRDGRLTLQDLAEMPHATCALGKSHTPAERQLETLGITPKVQVSTPGFSVLPFLVSGTELVALVPERLALRYESFAGCAVVPTPFPDVPLVEAMYWHHNRHSDPAHRWLRETVRQVGASLEKPSPAEIAPVDARHAEETFPELSAAS